MKRYTHLTEQERCHIYQMKKQQFSLRIIANIMNRSISTISRELKRNTGKKGYRHKQATNLLAVDIKRKVNTSNSLLRLKIILFKNSSFTGVLSK